MGNMLTDVYVNKFNYNRLRTDKAWGNSKYDNNKINNKTTKNTYVCSAWDTFPSPKMHTDKLINKLLIQFCQLK